MDDRKLIQIVTHEYIHIYICKNISMGPCKIIVVDHICQCSMRSFYDKNETAKESSVFSTTRSSPQARQWLPIVGQQRLPHGPRAE